MNENAQHLTIFVLLLAFALSSGCQGIDAETAYDIPDREGLLDGSASVEALPAQVQPETLVANLQEPWGFDFLPDGKILITEKSGSIQLIAPSLDFQATEVSGAPTVALAGQGGLLDVLVHPDFERNHWIYLSYVIEENGLYTTRVSRVRLVENSLVDRQVLFTAAPMFKERRHFGSRLLLDNGYLFITVGDRGNRHLAQDLSAHNGKVLRLLQDGSTPADNPFVEQHQARAEIFSYGHRNPQGIAKHPSNGSIWISEHGPQGGDEINILKAGKNYGWPRITYGEEYGGGKIGEGTHLDGLRQPLVHWVPSIGTGGITFYTGDLYPHWGDSLLVAGLRSANVSRLELVEDGLGKETRLLVNLKMRIRDVQVGPDGMLYLLADGSKLLRLELEH